MSEPDQTPLQKYMQGLEAEYQAKYPDAIILGSELKEKEDGSFEVIVNAIMPQGDGA